MLNPNSSPGIQSLPFFPQRCCFLKVDYHQKWIWRFRPLAKSFDLRGGGGNLFPRDVIAILPVFKFFTPHFLWLNFKPCEHLRESHFPTLFSFGETVKPHFSSSKSQFSWLLHVGLPLFFMGKTDRKTMEKNHHIFHIFPPAPAPLWPRSFAAFPETAPPWHGGSARPLGRSPRGPGDQPFEKWRGRPWEKWWV